MSYPKKEERIDAVRKAIQAITQELNGGSRKEVAKVIVDTLRTEHRTLQASFWSAILLAQIEYGDFAHDLRNQDAVEFAQAVKKLAQTKSFDFGGFRYV